MSIEPEYLILAFIILSLTTVSWMAMGGSPGLAALTTLEPQPQAEPRVQAKGQRRPAPTRLVRAKAPAAAPVATAHAKPPSNLRVTPPFAPATPVEGAAAPRATNSAAAATPLLSGSQIGRLSHIVGSAVATARQAEHLHRSANEQLDAAHYALQNLMIELAAVMPVAAAASVGRSAKPLPMTRPARPSYETQSLAA